MAIKQAVLMAVLQGLTEFLPVSSSGHLVLAKTIMGIQTPGALWEVALHLGTLLAICAVLGRELWQVITGFAGGAFALLRGRKFSLIWAEPNFRMACFIGLATIPAGVIGVLFGDAVEQLFSNPFLCATMIFVTAEILWLTRAGSRFPSESKVRLADSLWIGVAQAVALIPGISRSGITISTGLFRGVSHEQAARFSFLLAVPAILGAAVLKAKDLNGLLSNQVIPMIVGVAAAAITGYIALRMLIRLVRIGRLHWLAYYCWTISILSLTYLWTMSKPV